jgi:hypothetical protein
MSKYKIYLENVQRNRLNESVGDFFQTIGNEIKRMTRSSFEDPIDYIYLPYYIIDAARDLIYSKIEYLKSNTGKKPENDQEYKLYYQLDKDLEDLYLSNVRLTGDQKYKGSGSFFPQIYSKTVEETKRLFNKYDSEIKSDSITFAEFRKIFLDQMPFLKDSFRKGTMNFEGVTDKFKGSYNKEDLARSQKVLDGVEMIFRK